MKLTVDEFHVSEHASDIMVKIDQLTLVRNYVRKQFDNHAITAEGEVADEIEVEVCWLDGDMESLVFDRSVGFPINPKRDWYGEWIKEVSS